MRCWNHYYGENGCDNEATHVLYYGDKKNPGGWVCERHALETLNEYEKLPLEFRWYAVQIDSFGDLVPSGEILYGKGEA